MKGTQFEKQEFLNLFCRSGLPSERGFFGELGRILLDLVFGELPMPTVERLRSATQTEFWQTMKPMWEVKESFFWHELTQSISILSSRIYSAAYSNILVRYDWLPNIQNCPFEKLKSLAGMAQQEGNVKALFSTWQLAAQCISKLGSDVEKHGVNVQVLFQISTLRKLMERLNLLLRLLNTKIENDMSIASVDVPRLFYFMLLDAEEGKSLRGLFAKNLVLVAKRITEHAGRTGEKYVAANRAEYFGMFWIAFGAGIVTVATTILKFFISTSHHPPLFSALLVALNYAASFLIIHAFHLSLATKQSSMTAAHLAHSVKTKHTAVLVEQISRSQAVAVFGNLFSVVPLAMLLSYISRLKAPPTLSGDKTLSVLHSTDILDVRTHLFAIGTGVLLWLASVVSGWIDNWSIYHSIPQRMRNRGGTFRAIAGLWENQIGAVTGVVVLGIFLAIPYFVGALLGISLDVRHVTLGAGSLAFASVHNPDAYNLSQLIRAILGIFAIGFWNVSTSFGISLLLALRAQGFGLSAEGDVLKGIFARMRSKPLLFLYPYRLK